jgi:hypothetical protein
MDGPLYDGLYRRWRRNKEAADRELAAKKAADRELAAKKAAAEDRSLFQSVATWLSSYKRACETFFAKDPKDELRELAEQLQRRQFAAIRSAAAASQDRPATRWIGRFGPGGDDGYTIDISRCGDQVAAQQGVAPQQGAAPQEGPYIPSTFSWAMDAVRLRSPAAVAEVDTLLAQSKMFRSVTIILVAAVAVLVWRPGWAPPEAGRVPYIGLIVALVALWRFLRLRWDATHLAYRYFLALALPPQAPPPSA